MTTVATTTTRITLDGIVAMDTKGFYALRRDCVTWGEIEDLDGDGALYASSCDGELYAPVGSLLEAAVEDSRLSGGWGVSTGSGRASMRPRYVVEIGGRDAYLAPAYPGAYEDLHKAPYYA